MEVPELDESDLSLRGRVIKRRPSFYGQSSFEVKVTGAWERTRTPLDFQLHLSAPAGEELFQGNEMLMRVSLKGRGGRIDGSALQGRAVSGSWFLTEEALSAEYEGRRLLSRTIDGLGSGPASGLLGAISLGDRWRVDERTRDVLRRTGTYHLLAISGVHVAAAAIPFLLFARLGGFLTRFSRPLVCRSLVLFASAAGIGYYLRITGPSSPALRAVLYLIIGRSSVLAARNSSPMTVLSWCVTVIVLFGVGSQPDLSLALSAVAVTGIILSHSGPGGLLSTLFRVSLGAILFTLPMGVWLAGGISIIAPVANIVAGISFGLFLIPGAILMDLSATIPGNFPEIMMTLWLRTADFVLAVLVWLAGLPFSFESLSRAGCVAASLSGVVGLAFWRRKRFRPGIGMMIFITVAVISGGVHSVGEKVVHDDLVITFPGVGQADGTIIRYKGRTVLVDCGPSGLPGRNSPIAAELQRLGVRHIDALFLSHLHPDHAGGLKDIAVMWPLDALYLPSSSDVVSVQESMGREGYRLARVEPLKPGDRVDIGSLAFTVVRGPGEEEGGVDDMNRRSMQLLFEVENFTALFTGDAGWDQVRDALNGIERLDLLKIPHHGSKKDFPPRGMNDIVERIKRSDPFVAVCPSRLPGKADLPAPEVVSWFRKRGVNFWYTDDTGVKIRYKKGGPFDGESTIVDKHYRF